MKRKSMVCFISLLASAALIAAVFYRGEERVYASQLDSITSDSIEAKKDEVVRTVFGHQWHFGLSYYSAELGPGSGIQSYHFRAQIRMF